MNCTTHSYSSIPAFWCNLLSVGCSNGERLVLSVLLLVSNQHHTSTVSCRDFQPRLGVVARTLARALPDLFHMMLLIFVLLLFVPYLLCIMFGETTAQLCTLRGEHALCDSQRDRGCIMHF